MRAQLKKPYFAFGCGQTSHSHRWPWQPSSFSALNKALPVWANYVSSGCRLRITFQCAVSRVRHRLQSFSDDSKFLPPLAMRQRLASVSFKTRCRPSSSRAVDNTQFHA